MYLNVIDRCATKEHPPPSNVLPHPQLVVAMTKPVPTEGRKEEGRKAGRKDV